MSDVIIYRQDSGVVAVIYPTPEAVAAYGIEAIAEKDVPEGKPFKIVAAADLPPTREQRLAWTVDEADLDDGIGAAWDVFEEAE